MAYLLMTLKRSMLPLRRSNRRKAGRELPRDLMHGLQQVFHNPVTWHILANQVLLTSTLVCFDHFEAIESPSHGSCVSIDAVEIAQDEDIHLGPEET